MAIHIQLVQHNVKRNKSYGTVVLDGIGRFSLRVESIGVDDPKDFNIGRHITRIVCNILPAIHRGPGGHLICDLAERVKVVWAKGFKR